VGYAANDDEPVIVVHGIHDAMVANSDAVVVAAGQLRHAIWPGICGEGVYRLGDSRAEWIMQAPKRAQSIRMQPDLVQVIGGGVYRSTSDHGTLRSRSSRALSAARLSSR
jgi:hypothetical protein